MSRLDPVFARLDALPVELAETARRGQGETGNNEGMYPDVALRYGGHDGLVAAPQGLVRSRAAGVAPARLPRQSRPGEFSVSDVYRPTIRELGVLRAIRACRQRDRRSGR
jgi:undecaprenyl pyrophosphate synthase